MRWFTSSVVMAKEERAAYDKAYREANKDVRNCGMLPALPARYTGNNRALKGTQHGPCQ